MGIKLRWHFFCKNEGIYETVQDKFLDEKVNVVFLTHFRKCKVCGKITEFNYDSEGGYWGELSKEKSEILNKKLTRINDKLYLKKD